jgi:DNA-binding CsgD family transcriptional regulator
MCCRVYIRFKITQFGIHKLVLHFCGACIMMSINYCLFIKLLFRRCNMTIREEELLDLIRKNPSISQNELAEVLGITRSSVAVHITNLIKKGRYSGQRIYLEGK